MNKRESNYKIQKSENVIDNKKCEYCKNILLLSPYKQRCLVVQETSIISYGNDRVNSISLMGICDNFQSTFSVGRILHSKLDTKP